MSLGLLSSIACSKSNVDVEELFAEVPINVDGNPDGKVTLVEFLDYRCSDCREMVPTIAQLIDENPNLRIVYRFYPVLGLQSEYVERVALAAQLQGRFLALHRLLVNAKQPLTKEVVLE
jgi:protein-disulfide isomerase